MCRGSIPAGVAMTTAVVGAGPVGMVCALALAMHGDEVLLLDPDAGPAADGTWRRTGVMQFHHPHFFRHQARQVLEQHVPPMWEAVVAGGCVVNDPPEEMRVPASTTTLAARRSTSESALRTATRHERIQFVAERADRVVVEKDRVTDVVAGKSYEVDRVVVASGRSGGFGDDLRAAGESTPCGQSYVSRMYRARPGVGSLRSWTPLVEQYDGYLAVAFPQEAGTLSALIVRPSGDSDWSLLWATPAFDVAAAAIPVLAPWTDPERFEPITDVMRGGTLVNSYRGQGSPPAGIFFVGDAVCTTNPSAGRGISLGLLQAGALLALLAEHHDAKDVSAAFEAWCLESIRPWYDDHVASDAEVLRTYAGADIDVDGPLSSDVLCAAVEVDPSLERVVSLYLGMVAPSSSPLAIEDRVRELLRGGWRPRPCHGPGRDELLESMRLVSA